MRECLREEVLQSYIDGELAGETVESVTSHLAGCVACSASVRELERENNLVAAALALEFEASVPTAQLRQRIDAAIAEDRFVNSSISGKAGLGEVRGWFQSLSDLFTVTPQRAFGYASLVAILTFAIIFAVQRSNFQKTIGSQEIATANPQPGSSSVATKPVDGSSPTGVAPARVAITGANKPVAATLKSQPRRNSLVASETPSRRASEANHVKLLPGERSYLQTLADLDSTMKLDKGRMRPAIQAEYERNLAFVDRALAAARTAAKNHPNDPDAAEFMFSAYQNKVDLLNTVADARVYNRQH
ncbi:MAG: zf-HC2 domain-containing protein [Acidobacteriota bacterium]|nr:zf-HC2 domain-containing protein [Acidobacteriota bacterium]